MKSRDWLTRSSAGYSSCWDSTTCEPLHISVLLINLQTSTKVTPFPVCFCRSIVTLCQCLRFVLRFWRYINLYVRMYVCVYICWLKTADFSHHTGLLCRARDHRTLRSGSVSTCMQIAKSPIYHCVPISIFACTIRSQFTNVIDTRTDGRTSSS